MTWPAVRLGDVCDMQSGGTPRRGVDNFYGGPIPWVKISDLETEDGVVVITEESISTTGLSAIGNRLFSKGTILLAMYGSVGKTGVAGCALATNQAILGLVPRDAQRLDSRFLRRWLDARQPDFVAAARGVTQANISKTIVENARIPLPPIDEQRRIADILDKADAIRRKRKEAIALTEKLLRSAFLEMFGDPMKNPKGWPVKPLGEVIKRLEAGWSANGEARQRTPQEYGVLKVSAVTSGVFRPNEHKAVPASKIDRELVTPRAGDLLFSRANTRELVAATCLVERNELRLFLPDKLWRVVPRPGFISAPYLRFLLADDRFRGELTKTATGTSGSMLNVSMEKLRSLRGPIPPFSVQQRFADTVWKSLRVKARYEAAERDASNLFASLVASAFSRDLSSKRGSHVREEPV